MNRTIVGLVVPEAVDAIPAEAPAMFPDIAFISKGIGLRSLSTTGYDEAIDRVVPAAQSLASRGADAVMVVGTSLTFYRGAAFNAALIERVSTATGLPAGTMSGAIVDQLREVGASKLAVVTGYSGVVNELLKSFLQESSFDVLALRSVSVARRVGEAAATAEHDICGASLNTFREAARADAILIVCGGLRTLDVTPRIEMQCGVPVVSSMPAAIRAAAMRAGERIRSRRSPVDHLAAPSGV